MFRAHTTIQKTTILVIANLITLDVRKYLSCVCQNQINERMTMNDVLVMHIAW